MVKARRHTRRNFLRSFGLAACGLYLPRAQAAETFGGFSIPYISAGMGNGNGLLANLTAYWKMDELTGTRFDSTANALNLTDNNSNLASAPGKIGNAVVCSQTSASNALIHAGNSFFNTAAGTSFSFSAWIKANGFIAGNHGIICHDNNTAAGSYDLYSDGTNVFWFVLDNTITARSITIATVASLGTLNFHHFAFGYDDANKQMWTQLDGAARTTISTVNPINTSSVAFTVGNFASLGLPEQVLVDELAYWQGRVLMAGDVSLLYNGGSSLPFSSFS